MQIKRADAIHDFAILQKLDRQIFPEDDPHPKSKAVWWIVYDDEGNPAGFAGLEFMDRGRTGFLVRAGLLKHLRGKGIHHRLIRIRERYAKNQGAARAVAYTHTRNAASVNNLIAHGYRVLDPRERANGWGQEGPWIYLAHDL